MDDIAASAAGPLKARPRTATPEDAASAGRSLLTHAAELYVPRTYDPSRPNALVVTLHGANRDPAHGFGPLLPLADDAGLILLGPKSKGPTWDIVYGRYGDDGDAIDDLLAEVFARFVIDPRRVFISGFSDGASYALSLGLANGDLFDAIVAFSPGFAQPAILRGKPRVFVSHGTDDDVIPSDRTSRRLVPRLRSRGYEVTFVEFAGAHTVPPHVASQAVSWLG
jgi:phospholipase/carboxylesterase